ncbi:hypothetical protein TrRE_jg9183 [Triparma retinervis]|uniref:Uncharacterized protein n=1 Tax=Triparma retinervis TaxID=2557542 RepID=A0A9W7A1T3_9STRA|nr:hypothetical protein TrRE_jg9183 [Triparma retinervis]
MEEIAASLKPVAKKDFSGLLESLNSAQAAYKGAFDDAGVKVVERMKNCLRCLRAADVAWYDLAHNLKKNDYSASLSCLMTARKCLYESSQGLPYVNPELDQTLSVLLNEDMTSLTMIAELAEKDGTEFKAKAAKALEKKALDKAASHASSANKCFTWIVSRSKLLSPDNYKYQKKEDFSSDESELNLSMDKLEDVPESKLCEMLMERFLEIFPSIKEDPFKVNVNGVQKSIERVKEIMRHVTESNALIKADNLMDEFYNLEENDLDGAIKSLEEAKTVYATSGYLKKAAEVSTIRVNTMGDVALEKVMPLLTEGKHVEAQKFMREAIYYYDQSGNRKMYQSVNQTLLCSQGDQLLTAFDKALEKGDYDTALGHGLEAVELYASSGDKERIALLGDPKVVVWRRAVDDADTLKLQSLKAVDERNLTNARQLASNAKSCLAWAGESGASIDDIFGVIKMAEKRWKGDELMKQALECVGDADRENTKNMLWLATQAYQVAQLEYQQLMGRAADIIAESETDPTFGLELEDNISKIYNVCRDGVKIANLQTVEVALKADEKLDEIGVLIRAELFGEAKDLIDEVRKTYFEIGFGEGNDRIKKTDAMLELVACGAQYYDSVGHKKFEESKEHIQRCKDLLRTVNDLPPATIMPPKEDVFGTTNAADTVIVRAITSGEKDLKDAKDYLKEKNFVASLKECDKAMRSYDWVAQYKDFSEIEDAVNELKAFISLVKREQAYSEGEACLEKALEAMADDSQHFPKAVLKAGEAIDCFIRSEAQDRVDEAMKLKAKANGCLFEKQARGLWAKNDFIKALDKCVKGHKCFEDSGVEDMAKKLGAFTKRVEGDLIMLSYDEAVTSTDWDRACKVMTDAHDCYNQSNDPKIMSLIEGIVPKNKVMQEATKKGDEFKTKATSALHRGGGTVVAQEFLNKAKECFLWSEVSLAKAGVNMVQKDIDSAEFQEKADKCLDEAYESWIGGGVKNKDETVRLMGLAKGYFKQAGASCFKSANDTSYIINVIDSADVNSLKCIEEMLVEEKIIDALDKCSDVLSGWTAVVRIQDPSKTVKKFVDFYVEKEQQLILVMSFLSKKNSIVAEIQGNRWGPPPVAMCEELMGIHGHLKEMAVNWKLTFAFEFLEPLVIAAQYACGVLKEEEKVVVKEKEEEKEGEKAVVVVEEEEEEAAVVLEEKEEEEAAEVVEEKEEATTAVVEEKMEEVGEAEEVEEAEEVGEVVEVGEIEEAAEEGSQATDNQYADEEFESSVETTTTANKDVVAEGGDLEFVDATNDEDEKKYEKEDFES